MTTHEVKRSIARSVTKHTISAAFLTVGFYEVPTNVIADLQEDLYELEKLESCPLVDVAVELVTIGLTHAKKPTAETFDKARVVRDKLGGLLISAKEIAG